MFLSFIIPVYNCERLIGRCIESIECQDFNDFEVILINDGSKDNSFLVCQDLSKRYDNIKVLTQENKGASSARNAGLKVAQGEYVWFVDADDYISDGIVKTLYSQSLTNNCDAYAMNYKYITIGKETDILLYSEDADVKSVDYLHNSPCMFAATKVYKKVALKGLQFQEGLTNIEDFLFNILFLSSIESIHTLPVVGYVYDNTNQQSTSRNRDKKHLEKLSNNSIEVHRIINEFLQTYPQNKMRDVIVNLLNYSITGHIYSLLRFYTPDRLKEVVSWYKRHNLYPIGKTGKKRADIARFFFNRYGLLMLVSNFRNL